MSFKWEAPKAKDKKGAKPSAAKAAGGDISPEVPAAAAMAAAGITFDAVICRLKTMADGGLRVELDLPELAPEEFATLYALRNTAIKITIK